MSNPAPEKSMGGGTDEAAAARAAVDGAVSKYETPLLRYVGQLLGRGTTQEAEDVVQETFLRYYREVSRDGGDPAAVPLAAGRSGASPAAELTDARCRAGIRNASTWLFRVAHNLAMDALRREARQNRNGTRTGSPRDVVKRILRRGSPRPTARGESPIRAARPEALRETACREPVDRTTGVLEELIRRESGEKALAELQRLPEEQRQVLLLRVIHGMKLSEISEVTGLTPGNAAYRISQGLQELARRLKERGVI